MKRFFAAALAVLSFASARAQTWDMGEQYYRKGMYAEAVAALEGKTGAMADGYRVLSIQALKLDGREELANAYLKKWPESILVPQVSFFQGLDCFDQERYKEALILLDAMDPDQLQKSQLPEYTYKLGYSAYRAGEWEYARQVLARIPRLPYSDYTAPASYTLGYVDYAHGLFKEAEEWFERAGGDVRFADLAKY